MRALVPTSFAITLWNSQIVSSPCLFSACPSLSRRIANPLIFFRRDFLWHPRLLTSCSSDASSSVNYGGWDDPRLGFDSSRSGESNQLLNLLQSLGIDDRKYMIVFVLGFVCAISISRVRFSSIMFFPACAIAVAVGFAIGFVNNYRRVDRFNPRDEKLAVLVEKLKNLVELFNGFDEKIVDLKNGIRRGVDSNHVTVSDLENFADVLESIGVSVLIGRTTVQDMINNNQSVVVLENQEIKSPPYTKTSKRRKEAGFDPWQLLAGGGLFGPNMAAAQKPVRSKDTVRRDRTFTDSNYGIEEDNVRRHSSNSGNSRRFLEKEEYRYKKSRSLYTNNKGNRANHMETSSLFQQERVIIEDDHFQTHGWLGSSPPPSSSVSDDMVFNRYLVEANTLVKQAREVLRSNGDEQHLQTVLNNSAKLLSEALDMRPMSLLAAGQLGNTYLLHGELKLKISRELRGELWNRVSEGREDEDDEVASNLVNVCEECEELLVEAGRKYRLALSIDGEDMKALYNWGLALSFRGQLIADIGPEAAVEADKIFMAAIDKFDSMISRSNVYAPEALFRWGVALQQRSRLQLRNSKEKTKLLQQAKRLYEDALDMDSDNVQAKEALYSCINELDLRLR